MKRFFEWWYGEKLELIDKKLDYLLTSREPEGIEFLRHRLGSVDLSDVEDKKQENENERKEYCAAISAVFPRIEKDVKMFLYEQLLFSSNQAETWEKVIFGRGTFNGMDILLEHWKKANEEHMERMKPKDVFDAHSPIGDITT